MAAQTQTAIAEDSEPYAPPVPWNLRDTGLSRGLVEHLIFNILYVRGEISGRTVADTMGLSFSVIEPIMHELKIRQFLEVKRSMGYGLISSDFALSEAGRKRAREFADMHQYAGPAPVPLSQYAAGVEAQRLRRGWLRRDALASAYKHMVVSPFVLDQIGPAVNAGKAFLVYGKPGNGKTYLAEALMNLESTPIFVPHTIEFNGTIIQVFNPLNHQPVDGTDEASALFNLQRPYDSRWIRCRRPFITTGGELSVEMLELAFNAASRIYDAPCHLKANNGIYLIDDFGRQKITPAELLNRWIVPMESHMDHINLPTGGKMSVPFEAFLIFSTNLNPDNLGDEAFLRRIQYKMFVQNPDRQEFVEIFHRVCEQNHLECPRELLDDFINRHYVKTGMRFRRCHPRDVISHAIDFINFRERPYELTQDVLDHSFGSCFISDPADDEPAPHRGSEGLSALRAAS
ncbi:MAG TPA: hypothetical protein VGL72_13330 [Bryobacteraceae bacterium]|jgi:hypothetical protein